QAPPLPGRPMARLAGRVLRAAGREPRGLPLDERAQRVPRDRDDQGLGHHGPPRPDRRADARLLGPLRRGHARDDRSGASRHPGLRIRSDGGELAHGPGRAAREDAGAGARLPQSGGGRRRRLTLLRRRFCSSRRSTAAFVGLVARRRRGTRSASRRASTSRSVASSRLRHWLRSSWAIARITGPARDTTRRFCASVSAEEASTSKVASTRVSLFCACWPPGPLEREKRSSISERGMETDRVTRIDSPAMSGILLDVDGVLHVSGHPILGGAKAIARLREAGHRLRFVTNNTTHSRRALADEIRSFGVELDDEELQTTPIAAAHA